ncbi:GH16 domain-containing protein [Mycena indigotica]|uniref:GH16 domain-containing protein n=1 Tax=Mycena indigotica TaxID=2126181 RepID=A0A8H6TCW9_9AGAR|nr:GH16 domain-containing protein [Mycena indigotica]KAF7315383.1 GH16 domain-containing protein [Mycena indigotica]
MLRILLVLSLAIRASSYTVYSVKDSYLRNDFLDWDWYSSSDPTHGRVNYVTKSTAIAENLTDATDTTFRMRADTKKMLSPSDPGRDSIRISSPTAYSESVFILDLWHMPTGCATWPA